MELYSADTQHGGHVPSQFGYSGRGSGLSARDITTAALAGASVLLTGPSGDALALARRLHDESSRRDGPFTVIDCGRPDAELAGRVLDALGVAPLTPPTGRAGSVYLKNVGKMPLDLQRTLAELLILPGRSRVMASTPEPLLDRVLDGRFDDCLYYRLNVIHLVLGGGPR